MAFVIYDITTHVRGGTISQASNSIFFSSPTSCRTTTRGSQHFIRKSAHFCPLRVPETISFASAAHFKGLSFERGGDGMYGMFVTKGAEFDESLRQRLTDGRRRRGRARRSCCSSDASFALQLECSQRRRSNFRLCPSHAFFVRSAALLPSFLLSFLFCQWLEVDLEDAPWIIWKM